MDGRVSGGAFVAPVETPPARADEQVAAATGRGCLIRRYRPGLGTSGWQTAGVVFVVFVADAFGQWLVEQFADAGRKKLTELILGSEQERALRKAADAAVWAPPRR